MAKYTNTELMAETSPVYEGKLKLVSHTKTKVVFEDSDSGDTIIYKGHDLAVKKGIIVSGDLTGWSLANSDQDPYTIVKDFKIDLDKIHAKTTVAFAEKVYDKILSGNDTMTGSSASDSLSGLGGNDKINGNDGGDYLYGGKGNDTINGGAGIDGIFGGKGNDRLTGGADYDVFYFAKGDGNDTITDFNADDSDLANHDYIGAKFEDATITATGSEDQHTLISFGNGSTITLLNVLSTAVGAGDFYIES